MTRMGILYPLAERYVHRYVLSRFFKVGIFIDSGTSVAVALAGVFAILINNIYKIMEIFEQLDNLKSRGVFCQY